MERITERLENNERIVRINGTYGDAMRKLADYEDTGLSPEEINKLKTDFTSLTKETLWKDAINDEWMK